MTQTPLCHAAQRDHSESVRSSLTAAFRGCEFLTEQHLPALGIVPPGVATRPAAIYSSPTLSGRTVMFLGSGDSGCFSQTHNLSVSL